MPKLGLTMTEGTLTQWLVREGQAVKQGEILFEFESDKSTMEYEAPTAGFVGELLVAEGSTIPCGTAVMTLGSKVQVVPAQQGEVTAAADVVATPAAKRRARELGVEVKVLSGRGPNGRVHVIDVEEAAKLEPIETEKAAPLKISPLAKRMAADLGIDLDGLSGSGPGGRITRDDVLTAVRHRPAAVEESPAHEPGDGDPQFWEKLPLTGVRRVIAQHMSSSAFTAPHVTLHTEVDATRLVEARRELNEDLAGRGKISFNALLIAVAAKALSDFPQMNACLIDDEICRYADINVGLAVDSERGLLVPVIRGADQMSILAIQQIGDALIERALAGKSLPDDLAGGTFTVTNLGPFGVDAFTPIINQPQAAILGVGRIINKPVGVNGEIVLRDQLSLSLSFDHRLVDGGPAARFLQRIGQLIERPLAMML